jgi:hypothetical protein
MIPGASLRTSGRTCLRLTAVEPNCVLVEPMRFLFPFEAKREVEAAERYRGDPSRCHHLYRKASV